jgi:hypothetical protein
MNSKIRLFITFIPAQSSRNSFVFDGFGTVSDTSDKNRTSECALVLPDRKSSDTHNIIEIRGVAGRASLLKRGILVSIEMQQLIDPFHYFEEYRILLQFRIRKRLRGWSFSKGIYYMWNPRTSAFLAIGWTNDINISR